MKSLCSFDKEDKKDGISSFLINFRIPIFLIASLLIIIAVLVIMSRDPKRVYKDGISLKIKIPDIVAKIKLKYLIGVTNDASASL